MVWRQRESWVARVTAWLGPRMRKDARRRLRPGRYRDLCWDDEAWLDLLQGVVTGDLGDLSRELAEDLRGAALRTYHGTRTEDAGIFFREGLRIHDRVAMTRRLKALMAAGGPAIPDASLDQAIAEIANDHDVGRLYIVVDERPLLRHAAHYLVYGSEWMLAIADGAGRRRLMAHGTPTLLEIDMPLAMAAAADRQAFARVMLREWARLACNRPDWTAPIDFTFCLDADLPPASIVGHSHPPELRDPINGYGAYRSTSTICRLCAPKPGPCPGSGATGGVADRT